MMNNTIAKMKQRKQEKRVDGIDTCNLDLDAGAGKLYMAPDQSFGSVWRHIWASAENEINKQKLESTKHSLAQTKQHKEKKASAAAKDWELGVPFKDAPSKSRAIKLVFDALDTSTKSNVTQVTVVMSEIVSRLLDSPLFDERKILFKKQQKNIGAMDKMFEHASRFIDSTKGERNKGNQDKTQLNLLTGVSALFIPDSDKVPLSISCSLLHLNRKSKYVSMGMSQQKSFDKHLQLSGPIELEELKHYFEKVLTQQRKRSSSGIDHYKFFRISFLSILLDVQRNNFLHLRRYQRTINLSSMDVE
jgi:hypothetical protein